MQRLACFRWTPGDTGAARTVKVLRDRLDGAAEWRELTCRRGVLLLWRASAADPDALLLPQQAGIVAGALFRRGATGHERVTEIGDHEIEAWRVSDCRRFTDRCWGNYLLVFHDRGSDRLHVLRDPTGSRPCFEAEIGNVALIVTHAQDYVRVVPECEVDDEYLSAFIAHSRMVSRRTAIAGLREILPGEHLILGRGGRTSCMFWRPDIHSDHNEGFSAAAARVRGEVIEAAGVWARPDRPILHQLSGGLDSSVALACLRRAAPDAEIVCLNERPLGAVEGDERRFARIAAAHARAPLREIAFDPGAIDYAKVRTPELTAKPSIAHLSFATPLPEEALADRSFALMTTGKGGDQLFQRSAPPALAVETVRRGLSLRSCIEAALDVAVRNKISIWGVLGEQVVQGLLRQPGRQTLSVAPLALPSGRATAMQWLFEHPWISEPRRLSPAQVLRTRRLIDLHYYHTANLWAERLPCAHVLTSQPIVEACLATAPWLMIKGGRDRALEREAFTPLLSPVTVERTTKGDSTRFFTTIMERALPFMRDILPGGELYRRGIVDETALSAVLTARVLPEQSVKANLMACLVAEIWVRRFLEVRQAARTAPCNNYPPLDDG